MSAPFACYEPIIGRLAALAGGVDLDKLETWQIQRWRDLAAAIGFESELESSLRAGFDTRALVRELQGWIDHHKGGEVSPGLATLRAELLEEWRGSDRSLWVVEAMAEELPGQGCVDGRRVFPVRNSGDYFREALDASPTPRGRPCPWPGRLVVHLGTWPWYLGSALHSRPPGLLWRSHGHARPAEQAAWVMASAWTIEGNARIAISDVLAHFRRFHATTQANFKRHGVVEDGLEFLPEGRHLGGPLGVIESRGYNHCLRTFAAFFALRGAMVQGRGRLPERLARRLATDREACPEPPTGGGTP